MANPIAEDILTPVGEIDPADWWPQLKLSQVKNRIDAFLRDGIAQAAAITDAAKNRQAVIQWAYYRSASEVCNRVNLNPGSEDARDEGSHSFLAVQLQYAIDLRDRAKAAFEELLAGATVVAGTTGGPRASRSTCFEVRLV